MSASLGQESVRATPRTISVPGMQMAMVDLPWWGDLEDSAGDYDLRAIAGPMSRLVIAVLLGVRP